MLKTKPRVETPRARRDYTAPALHLFNPATKTEAPFVVSLHFISPLRVTEGMLRHVLPEGMRLIPVVKA